ncbi:MAG: hypothetical protein Q9170_003550 [Blastenia crenularia]
MEIRVMIYKLALGREDPIDLWPDQFVKDFRSLSPRKCAMRHYAHVCRASVQCTCGYKLLPWAHVKSTKDPDCPICDVHEEDVQDDNNEVECLPNYGLDHLLRMPYNYVEFGCRRTNIYVRDQHDLRYIRTHLATELLITCKQIYTEASIIFWHGNRFMFSGKDAWLGLLRFFLTIGPAARQYITTLDISAPYLMYCHDIQTTDPHGYPIPFIVDERSKNNPKLHMVKVQRESIPGSHLRRVSEIILADGFLQQLNLLVASDRGIRQSRAKDWGGLSPPQRFEHYIDSRHPLRMIKKTKVNLIVNQGGVLDMKSAFSWTDALGRNLVCHRGSLIRDSDYISPLHGSSSQDHGRVLEGQQTWRHYRYSSYEGIPTLFGDEEVFDDLQEDEIYYWSTSPAQMMCRYSWDDVQTIGSRNFGDLPSTW